MEAEQGLLPRFDNFLVENVVKIPAAQPDKAGKTVCLAGSEEDLLRKPPMEPPRLRRDTGGPYFLESESPAETEG